MKANSNRVCASVLEQSDSEIRAYYRVGLIEAMDGGWLRLDSSMVATVKVV
jgi:hypothetical protein